MQNNPYLDTNIGVGQAYLHDWRIKQISSTSSATTSPYVLSKPVSIITSSILW